LMMHVEALQEENETLRVSLDLEKSALANLKEEMKQAQLNQEVCVTLVKTSKVLTNES